MKIKSLNIYTNNTQFIFKPKNIIIQNVHHTHMLSKDKTSEKLMYGLKYTASSAKQKLGE